VFLLVAVFAIGTWLVWKQGLIPAEILNKAAASASVSEASVPPQLQSNTVHASLLDVEALSAPPVPLAPNPKPPIALLTNRPIHLQAFTDSNSPSAKSRGILEAQIALDRMGISAGSIDGVPGSQTRAALRAFQSREGLPITGALDALTRAQLPLLSASITNYRVAPDDLERLRPLASTWLGKSEQPRLDYETVLELVAERSHAHPKLMHRLNPTVDWSAMVPGTLINVPVAGRLPPETKAAYVRIRLGERTLQAFDAAGRLLAHFPCSIAARVEKRPVGELRVIVVVPNPDYLFKPDNFPESAEARELGRKLRLNPGPNNPVGTAWIGLNLSGYGIHGTPKPEEVGRTESHGCFRLSNWNAEYLLQLVMVGTTVQIEP
jgi:peptidoglycan hydrolase-like protein with peptidoglycan-binding domain